MTPNRSGSRPRRNEQRPHQDHRRHWDVYSQRRSRAARQGFESRRVNTSWRLPTHQGDVQNPLPQPIRRVPDASPENSENPIQASTPVPPPIPVAAPSSPEVRVSPAPVLTLSAEPIQSAIVERSPQILAPGVSRAERASAGDLWACALQKYRTVTQSRPPRIEVPEGENCHTYELKQRIDWAKSITSKLPLPGSAVEARCRIQNPQGKPFPLIMFPWANYWHIGQGPQGKKRKSHGGARRHYMDICKLLWMEGYPQHSFPPDPSSRLYRRS